MLKNVLLIGAATVALAAIPQLSSADDRGHWDRGHSGRTGHGYHYRDDRYRYRFHRGRHYRDYWRGGHFYGPHWRYRHGGRDHYRAGAFLGGALLGSAITYSLAHEHDHRHCTDRSHDHYRDGSRTRIAGCYRIERLPDGRERRVELPLSACR